MRSRFSAYVLKLEGYVLATWDKAKRPKHPNLANDSIEWKSLEIIDCKKGGANDNKGIVEFKAHYRYEDKDLILHEASRFNKQLGQWYYLDGVFKPTGKPKQPTSLGLNAPCQCGSGKKFKRCCGANYISD
ncbi:MAG: zinc chelation protein SecC [Methylococcaceae bacterium]|nr:zinc chelation protein SecC [Methylococcaceae bacterium]